MFRVFIYLYLVPLLDPAPPRPLVLAGLPAELVSVTHSARINIKKLLSQNGQALEFSEN